MELDVKIIKIDSCKRKIEISVKAIEFCREKELVKQFANQDDKSTLDGGELLSQKKNSLQKCR
jgi:ribosomal protein S1